MHSLPMLSAAVQAHGFASPAFDGFALFDCEGCGWQQNSAVRSCPACVLVSSCPTRKHRIDWRLAALLRPFGGPAVCGRAAACLRLSCGRPDGFASRPCGRFALVGGGGDLTRSYAAFEKGEVLLGMRENGSGCGYGACSRQSGP